ncbi:MAG: hypothetical protein C4523_00305 [Myxococcales bacterium]|nr:MAG: hypothetical protein C4523_00305 [Myxococcales bacterium]
MPRSVIGFPGLTLLLVALLIGGASACSSEKEAALIDGDADRTAEEEADIAGDGDEELIEAEAEEDAEPAADGDTDAEAEEDAEPEPPRAYYAAGGAMRTQDGHALYLRGVNIAQMSKYPPNYLYPLEPADIERLLTSGINNVRMLISWEPLSPDAPGEIDAAYLAAWAEQVRMLTEAGLYVVVDMHQDLWGPPMGNGGPSWSCPDELEEGYVPKDPWWLNYTSEQVIACFDNFWGSEELQGVYAEAYAAVAEAACAFDKVVGFDFMNEPYPGSGLGDLGFDNEILLPFYLKVMEAVEAACPGRLYFFEPTIGLFSNAPFAFPEALRDRVVMAPHFYPRAVHDPNTAGYDGDRANLEETILDAWGGYLDQGVPLWIGEFGGMTANPNFDLYMKHVSELYYDYYISSALWVYDPSDGGFSLLDSSLALKPVYEPVYRLPVPTRLPSKPADIQADWEAGELTFRVECELGRSLTMLLPNAGDRCTTEPAGLLPTLEGGPGFVEAACATAGTATVACTRGR